MIMSNDPWRQSSLGMLSAACYRRDERPARALSLVSLSFSFFGALTTTTRERDEWQSVVAQARS